MSHCYCMSHICCSFVRIKSYFVLCVCKDITKYYRSYQKIRENRYILHENVYTDKIRVKLTLIYRKTGEQENMVFGETREQENMFLERHENRRTWFFERQENMRT